MKDELGRRLKKNFFALRPRAFSHQTGDSFADRQAKCTKKSKK